MFAGREYEERIVRFLGVCWRRLRMGITAGSEDGEEDKGGEIQDDVTSPSDGMELDKLPPQPLVKIPEITFLSREAMQDLGMCLLWDD